MAQVIITTTNEEQEKVLQVLKDLNGETAPVSAMSVTLVLPVTPLLIMTMVFCLPV